MLTSTRRHKSVESTSPYTDPLRSGYDQELRNNDLGSPASAKAFSPFEPDSTDDISMNEDLASPSRRRSENADFQYDELSENKSSDEFDAKLEQAASEASPSTDIDNMMQSTTPSDEQRGHSTNSDIGDVTRMKAKRDRVENIVTNMKVKPERISSPVPSSTSDEGSVTPACLQYAPSRKRRLSEQIRNLQEQISHLQNEYHSGSVSPVGFDIMKEVDSRENRSGGMKKNIEEIVEGASSPSHFISQAMKLVAAASGAERSPHAERPEMTWDHQPKRPCLDDDVCSDETTGQPLYPGMSKRAVPELQYGNDVESPYDILVGTLKKELSVAFEKVAERSAKRVLEELRIKMPIPKRFGGGRKGNDYHSDNVFYPNERKDDATQEPREHAEQPYIRHNVSSFVVEGAEERMRTTSQSQMCFGNVEVRKEFSAGNDEPISPQENSFYPNLSSTCVRHQRETKTDNYQQRRENIAHSKNPPPPVDSPQLRPLSLVTRKVAQDRNPSPPSLELKPSDTEASEYGSISQLSSRHPASAVNLHQKSSNTSPLLQSSLSYTHGFSGSPKHTEPKHHYTSREASLSKDSPFFVPGTWPASSESSAFSQASTRAASPMSDRYSRFMKCEDVRNKIRTATQHNTPLSSMMGNQMFRKTIYPPISSTSSIYPFPSPQLPFPIHPMFQPGQLARALASDYGRIRENFDSASGLRFISTRTPTRDTMKQRGSLLGGHMDSKCVSPDFGGNCPDNVGYPSSIQEGLTPQHLKKAKLMFFYTRYPSANMLKAYFSDVKFSRATTSQLIKWFSNFREFYYIQMEKFARQALTDGVTDVGQIVVTRESEIMRVLNLHYNKSNDFRVPDQFIDVTQTSLQEFHQSIKSGKDRDPAWKKVIYKVICKLDHEVPDIFKTPNVLDRLCDAHL